MVFMLQKAVMWNVPAPIVLLSDSVSPDAEGESLSVLMVVVVAASNCLDGWLRSMWHVSLPSDAFPVTSLQLRRRGPTDPDDLRREETLLRSKDDLLHRQFRVSEILSAGEDRGRQSNSAMPGMTDTCHQRRNSYQLQCYWKW